MVGGQVIHTEPFIETRTLAATMLATLAIVPVTVAVWWLQHTHGAGQLNELAILIPGGILALVIYALCCGWQYHHPAQHHDPYLVCRRALLSARCCCAAPTSPDNPYPPPRTNHTPSHSRAPPLNSSSAPAANREDAHRRFHWWPSQRS